LAFIYYFYEAVSMNQSGYTRPSMISDIQTGSLFEHYASTHYFYDELLGEDGSLRPNWQTFFQSFHKLGNEEILNRSQDMLRLLKENGVTVEPSLETGSDSFPD
jgi:hypothetical protein